MSKLPDTTPPTSPVETAQSRRLAWLASRLPSLSPHQLDLRPASADASFRSYHRLYLPDGSTRILMDAPPDKEDTRPFIHVQALLQEAGVTVPEILDADPDAGFLLLSDLGNQGYLATLQADPGQADALFRPAVASLLRWQQASRPGVLPEYDDALLDRELRLFPEWYLGRHRGISLSDEQTAMLETLFRQLKESALAQGKVFVHRDYMPRNLMQAPGAANPAVIDFQDAVYGPISYDLASLFRDAFISWEEEQELDWVIRYWEGARKAGLPVPEDFSEFWRAYEWMGLQRHLKVLGIFCRLNYRDGKDQYLAKTSPDLTLGGESKGRGR